MGMIRRTGLFTSCSESFKYKPYPCQFQPLRRGLCATQASIRFLILLYDLQLVLLMMKLPEHECVL
jgi:hypothetical protein